MNNKVKEKWFLQKSVENTMNVASEEVLRRIGNTKKLHITIRKEGRRGKQENILYCLITMETKLKMTGCVFTKEY